MTLKQLANGAFAVIGGVGFLALLVFLANELLTQQPWKYPKPPKAPCREQPWYLC